MSDSISPRSKIAATPVVTTGSGTVKFFNASKGFGLVTPSDNSHTNLFVHVNTVRTAGLEATLAVGQSVSYTVTTANGRSTITTIAAV